MGEVDAAEDADDERVDEKGERRVGEGEGLVGKLAEGESVAGVKQEADVPEDGNAGVLPEGKGGRGEEERGGGEGVADVPFTGFVHDAILLRSMLRGLWTRIISYRCACDNNIAEYSSLKQIFCSSGLAKPGKATDEFVVGLHHARNGWSVLSSGKGIAQLTNDSFGGVVVNIAICSAQIAERFLYSAVETFKDEEVVTGRVSRDHANARPSSDGILNRGV